MNLDEQHHRATGPGVGRRLCRLPVAAMCALLVLVFWCIAASGQTSALLLAAGRAGPLTIGMTVDEVLERIKPGSTKLVDTQAEGYFTPVLEIFSGSSRTGKPAMVARIACHDCRKAPNTPVRVRGSSFIVDSIAVYDPRFQGAHGLGVGSRFGQIRKLYPEAKPRAGEGNLVVSPQGLGLSFFLDAARLPQKWYRTGQRDTSLIPDDTRVTEVVVYCEPSR